MRLAALLLAPLLLLGAPALATQTVTCRTTAPAGVNLTLVIGTVTPNPIASATLRDGRRTLTTPRNLMIGQSWIDERSLLLDLLSPSGDKRLARLKVGQRGAHESRSFTGTLEYGGRIARIACAETG